MSFPDNLHLLPNVPLARTLMSTLRYKDTNSQRFRRATRDLGRLLAQQALTNLPVAYGYQIETPLEKTDGATLRSTQALVPILRAGQALVDPFEECLHDPYIWHVGVSRDHETLKPREYSCAIPEDIDLYGMSAPMCFVLDPMLATGGSAAYVISLLKKRGATDITFVGVVGAPEGVAFLHEHHPDVPIHLAALDRELNEKGYILPGLGDFGNRYFHSNL